MILPIAFTLPHVLSPYCIVFAEIDIDAFYIVILLFVAAALATR